MNRRLMRMNEIPPFPYPGGLRARTRRALNLITDCGFNRGSKWEGYFWGFANSVTCLEFAGVDENFGVFAGKIIIPWGVTRYPPACVLNLVFNRVDDLLCLYYYELSFDSYIQIH